MASTGGVQRGYRAELGREFRENDAAGPVGAVVSSARPDWAGFGAGELCRLPSYRYSSDLAGKTWNMARAPNRARENGNRFVVTGVVTTGCGAHNGWLVLSCRVGENDYFSGLPYLLIYLLCVYTVCRSVCIKR